MPHFLLTILRSLIAAVPVVKMQPDKERRSRERAAYLAEQAERRRDVMSMARENL